MKVKTRIHGNPGIFKCGKSEQFFTIWFNLFKFLLSLHVSLNIKTLTLNQLCSNTLHSLLSENSVFFV